MSGYFGNGNNHSSAHQPTQAIKQATPAIPASVMPALIALRIKSNTLITSLSPINHRH